LDKETKRPRREIVDGQQRITTLVEFADGKFALGKNAQGHEGQFFNQLSEDDQDSFYAYTVSVDVIRNADRSDLLQMFRRMNAYTLPLNAALIFSETTLRAPRSSLDLRARATSPSFRY